MKKLLPLFSLLLFSFVAFSQSPDKKEKDIVKKKEADLVFLFENNRFYYTTPPDGKRTKIDTLQKAPIYKIVEEELVKNNIAAKDFKVIIDGDGVMNDTNFQLLLEALLDKKINQVRIRTSLYD